MAEQTISQALRRIKKIKGQLAEHRTHAEAAVTHLAAHKPAFAFGATRELANAAVTELLALQTAVAVANATTLIEVDGRKVPLAFAVRALREMTSEIAWLRGLNVRTQETTVEQERSYLDDGKIGLVSKEWTCHLPEAKRVELANAAQDRFDKLNDLVETVNHKTHVPPFGG